MEIEPSSQDYHSFTIEARKAIYQAIFSRRDVRSQFLPKVVPDEVLSRIITAAHHAPSVGFMQHWNFLLVRSEESKRRVHDAFTEANAEAAEIFDSKKRKQDQQQTLIKQLVQDQMLAQEAMDASVHQPLAGQIAYWIR